MNAYERVLAVLQHRLPDCVPVCPVLLLQGAAELGLDLKTYLSDGEHLAAGQLRLLEKFGHDAVLGIPHVVQDATAFGAGLHYFDHGPPGLANMVIRSYAEARQLAAPDPAAAPLLRQTLRAIELLARQVKGQAPILGACIAPFSLPSMLMGTELWIELLFEPPDLRRQVMEPVLSAAADFCVRWANAQLEAGADAVVLADGMASSAVITRQEFVELALPVARETVARIRGPVIHEGVGSLQPMLDLLPPTGVVAAVLDQHDDLAACKQLVGGRITLIGNLNNVAMRRWTPEQARQQAQAALAAAAPGGGFILAAQGPDIPLGVSDPVIHALVAAGHEWSYEIAD